MRTIQGCPHIAYSYGVEDGTRTHGLQCHKLALLPTKLHPPYGAPKGTRTPDPLLRRQVLYPAELLAHGSLFCPLRGEINVERVMGIEPTRPAWKAGVLPLNYTRISTASYILP